MALSFPITPVSADEIARRAYEQRYLIEERVASSLVEIVNQGIRDQVAHGLMEYEFVVPSFIYGFPRFDVQYVARRLREMYQSRGFHVSGTGARARLSWKAPQPPPPPGAPATPRPPPPPPPPPRRGPSAATVSSSRTLTVRRS